MFDQTSLEDVASRVTGVMQWAVCRRVPMTDKWPIVKTCMVCVEVQYVVLPVAGMAGSFDLRIAH
jgi:hypothetical protein